MTGGATLASDHTLDFQGGTDGRPALRWQTAAGRQVRFRDPQITLEDRQSKLKLPLSVAITDHAVTPGQATLRYALSLSTNSLKIRGAITFVWTTQETDSAVVGSIELSFNEPVHAGLEMACSFDVTGEPARQMGLPERNGQLRFYPLSPDVGGAGRFELGQAAKGPVPCAEIGIPVVGLVFDDKEVTGSGASQPSSPLQLAVAFDSYGSGPGRLKTGARAPESAHGQQGASP